MRRLEQEIQRAVFAHLSHRAMPGAVAFHCPNGGLRSKAEAAILKGLGVKAGIPDVLILHHGTLHALELKSSYGRLSPSQRLCLDALEMAGARVAIAHSLDEALVTLESWGVIRREYSNRVPETVLAPGGT